MSRFGHRAGTRSHPEITDHFRGDDGKTLEWSKIATFEVTIIDEATNAKLDLTSPAGHAILHLIKLVD